MTTANQPAAPRIVEVQYTPGKTFNTIRMTTSAHAIILWDNGARTILYGEEARAAYTNWKREQAVSA